MQFEFRDPNFYENQNSDLSKWYFYYLKVAQIRNLHGLQALIFTQIKIVASQNWSKMVFLLFQLFESGQK